MVTEREVYEALETVKKYCQEHHKEFNDCGSCALAVGKTVNPCKLLQGKDFPEYPRDWKISVPPEPYKAFEK